jgi:hypothetical protein
MARLPKFHIFLFLYLDSLRSFFSNLVGYWNSHNWNLDVWFTYIATCFTFLLARQNFDLVGSLTLLQIFIKFFYGGAILFIGSMVHFYESMTSFWV